MSKDEFPNTMTPNDVLEKIFNFMEDWKSKLYDMISFNSGQVTTAPQVTFKFTFKLLNIKSKISSSSFNK